MILGSLLVTTPASAIFYGDFSDPSGTVSFLDVADINGLYGGPIDQFGDPSGPTVSVNSLDFTPVNFIQSCSNCPGGGTTSDTISFMIDSEPGQAISTIDINEAGNFSLNAIGGGSFAQVLISASVTIDVFEVNGIGVSNVSGSSALSFVFDAPNFVGAFQNGSGLFTGSLSIDVNSILAAAGQGFGVGDQATLVQFTLDNTLQAFHSGAGGNALIRKRDFDSTAITVNGGVVVPEPSTALLFLGGLAALSGRRSQRR